MDRHTQGYKSQWYILNLSMWFWQWTCMSFTSVSLSEFIELNSMIHKQTSYVWEKCLKLWSFPLWYTSKILYPKICIAPRWYIRAFEYKVKSEFGIHLYILSPWFHSGKYENFQKVISAGLLDVYQRLPVSFICVNKNSRFYNRDIDL